MGHGIAAIHVRMERGKPTVVGIGQTPRGRSFIRASKTLECPTFSSKNFKQEMATAVEEMLAQRLLPLK